MTKSHAPQLAIRLIGHTDEDRIELNRHFAWHHRHGGTHFHAMHADNLQDPDLYLVNVDEAQAMAALERLRPAPLRPALLVGHTPPLLLAHPFLLAPHTETLLNGLEGLARQRAEARRRLSASESVQVPERRRRISTESTAERLRRPLREGGVLVVDKDGVFANSVRRLLSGRPLRVDRANEHRSAAILCRQLDISLVFINTGTPTVDPYRLCEEIREGAGHPLTVIFLIGRYFSYHSEWARNAGCEGFVNKPVSEKQIEALLEKYLPPEKDWDQSLAGAGAGQRQRQRGA